MNKDNNIPLCYQITVSNIIKIGDRVMSDFYVIFKSAQKNQNTWQSPLIHGKLTKQNANFPWNFIVDNPKLTVEFCQLDDRNKRGVVLGSTPLLLMKREGEEQFLIFGCNQQNRGRKVAEVQFSYCQCSLARSSNSDQNKKQNKKISTQKSADSNKRMQLQFSSDATVERQLKQQPLKVIPEQQQLIQEQTLREQQFNENYQTINPSKLQTLQFTYRNDKSLSYNDLEMLKEMEDATDKWYRSNFGKNRPTNLENIDFQHQTPNIIVKYQPNFQKLNGPQMITHIQLQNILANLDKKPKTIEIYGIELQNQKMKKTKIATVECGQSYSKDWKQLIRLPVENKGFGLQIITDDKQKLYCMIVNDGHFDKHKVDVYDQVGEVVGSLLYNIKLIKTIQVQTLDIVLQNPIVQIENQQIVQNDIPKKYEDTVNQQLNKSFIKSTDFLIQTNVDRSHKLKKESYLISKLEEKIIQTSLKLQNQAYFSKYKQQVDQQSPKVTKKRSQNPSSQKKSKLTPKNKVYEAQNNILNYINNQPYMGRNPIVKTNFRKKQYQLSDMSPQFSDMTHQVETSQLMEPQNQTHKALSEQNKRTNRIQIVDKPQFPSEKNMKKYQQNQKFRQQYDDPFKKIQVKNKEPIKNETFQIKRPQQVLRFQQQQSNPNHLQSKIEAIKKIGINLQKYKKSQSPYSSNIDQYRRRPSFQKDHLQARKIQYPSQQDEERQKVAHKKTYREPINVTPFFTSLSNLKFSKHFQIKTQNRQIIEQNSPLKNKVKTFDRRKVKDYIKNPNLSQMQKSSQKSKKNQKYQQHQEQKQLGVNTDRIAIVKNVLETSYKPQIYTQKQNNQDQKARSNYVQQPIIFKYQQRSNFDSLTNDNLNQHTKYSSQTIQPVTNQVLLDFLIITISVQIFQNIFGAKYLRIFVPNKYHYQTERIKNTSNLVWECRGFVFNHVSSHQNLYIELLSQSTNNIVKIGKAKVSAVQFKHSNKQGVIRSYLIRQDEVIGEVVLTFKNAAKNNNQLIDDQFLNKNRNYTTHQRKSVDMQQKSTQKNKTPPKQAQSLKKSKSKGKKKSDSLTQLLKSNKKQKTNRYMMNQSSKANIDSRVNPIRQKKFQGGRNIIIGRNSRFPLSEEEEYHKKVPGPGSYDVKTQFKKYS